MKNILPSCFAFELPIFDDSNGSIKERSAFSVKNFSPPSLAQSSIIALSV